MVVMLNDISISIFVIIRYQQICPKCSWSNAPTEVECQKVIARTRALVEEKPTSWVYSDPDKCLGPSSSNAVIRCNQPRPGMFHPTNTALESYSNIYRCPLPIAVRCRPDDVFQELFDKKDDIEQRKRDISCQLLVHLT